MKKILIIFILIGFSFGLFSSYFLPFSEAENIAYAQQLFEDQLDYEDMDIKYHQVTMKPGESVGYKEHSYDVPADNKYNIHVWWEVSGQVASWVSPQSMDYGIAPPGKSHPAWTWDINVPEYASEGIYSFIWTKHCNVVFQDQRVLCPTGFQRQFEVTVETIGGGGSGGGGNQLTIVGFIIIIVIIVVAVIVIKRRRD